MTTTDADLPNRRVIVAIALLVVVVDAGTKLWARSALANGPIDLEIITLRLAENPGIAFSLGAGAPAWVVTTVTMAATALIGTMALRGTLHPPAAAGLLLGGGVGNLLDRLAGGTVTDFLDLGWFPSFNVADVALNVGVAVVLLVGLAQGWHHEDEHDDETTVSDAVQP